MYIDKSFQLLSADSGKVAADETRRQGAGEDDAEFSELFGAELEQQDASKDTEPADAARKKTGQEVAALLAKQAKASAQQSQGIITEPRTMDVLAGEAELEPEANRTEGMQALMSTTPAATSGNQIAAEALLPAGITEEQEPWLAIISQSHDFKEILTQASQQSTVATEAETSLKPAIPTLDAERVTQVMSNEDSAFTLGTAGLVDVLPEQPSVKEGIEGSESVDLPAAVANQPTSALTSKPQTSLEVTAGAQATIAAGRDSQDALHENAKASTGLPNAAVTVREMAKVERPHLQTEGANHSDDAVIATPNQPVTTALAATDTGAATPRLQVSASAVLEQLGQQGSQGAKHAAGAPVDIELPIDISPDVAAMGAVTIDAAKGQIVAKQQPQTFAQFQKAANAAAALVQKQAQKQQAEQTLQPQQDNLTSPSVRFGELQPQATAVQADAPAAFNTLLPTERPISSGSGAMGSSTGQQQQQTASQLFATKLAESTSHHEQPAVQLLEPTAANQLKERVMFQLNQKIQSAEIKLAPEELGSMQIKVQLQQEQLSVQFVVQQAVAKEALEQQMPRLREMLQEQGIELTEGQVSQQREGSAEQRQARERAASPVTGAMAEDEPVRQQAIVRVSDRMVDYYA